MRVFVVIIIISLLSGTVSAQCLNSNLAYTEGEVLKYSVYYNWGFIWIDAGWVNFSVKPAVYKGKTVYHFDSQGASHKSYDWLYKVRDRYQSYVDKETLLPVWFHRTNFEGGFQVYNQYQFDWKNNRVFIATETSDRPFKKDTLALPNCTYDVLSLIYTCRNVDFSKLKKNDTVPVITVIDNEVFNLYIRYLGKETIKDRNNNQYRCIKFSALLVEGTIFKGGEDMFVWITDDSNKVPVLVEAKILVGSVKAYFNEAEGLKNPMKAKLN